MILSKLHLENFKKYTTYDIEFGEGLIGSSAKTEAENPPFLKRYFSHSTARLKKEETKSWYEMPMPRLKTP